MTIERKLTQSFQNELEHEMSKNLNMDIPAFPFIHNKHIVIGHVKYGIIKDDPNYAVMTFKLFANEDINCVFYERYSMEQGIWDSSQVDERYYNNFQHDFTS